MQRWDTEWGPPPSLESGGLQERHHVRGFYPESHGEPAWVPRVWRGSLRQEELRQRQGQQGVSWEVQVRGDQLWAPVPPSLYGLDSKPGGCGLLVQP